MTTKLLSEASKGKANFASGLFDISKAAKKQAATGARGSNKSQDSDPDDGLDVIKDDIFKGPPSFYEADVQKYMSKFDSVVE